jgi:hypothetical protein
MSQLLTTLDPETSKSPRQQKRQRARPPDRREPGKGRSPRAGDRAARMCTGEVGEGEEGPSWVSEGAIAGSRSQGEKAFLWKQTFFGGAGGVWGG